MHVDNKYILREEKIFFPVKIFHLNISCCCKIFLVGVCMATEKYFKQQLISLRPYVLCFNKADGYCFLKLSNSLCIQRPRQRSPPIIPTKGGAACVCLYKRRGMADFHHHFLDGYRYCSSTKPRLRIDLGTKKGLPFTACRNSIWFDFYDCSKNA